MPALAPEAPVANRNARAMVANAPTVAALSVALRIFSPVPRRSDGAHDRAAFFFNSFRWREKAGASMVARDSATLHPASRAGTCEAWVGRATRFRNFFVACR